MPGPGEPKRSMQGRSQYLRVRGLRYHVTHWGEPGLPRVFLLHGWMDAGASFAFLAEHLRSHFHLVAPDWRGFGRTRWAGDAYWFADYLGDLEALLEALDDGGPARLVGHSMGGNIACLYAGIRPERVSHLVSLEGFGLPDSDPATAPARYAQWLDSLGEPPAFRPYDSLAAFAERLRRGNPRLDEGRARAIARSWARRTGDGQWIARADPRHRLPHANLYHRAEAEACWRRVQADTLFVAGRESDFRRWLGDEDVEATVGRCFADARFEWVEGAGHMLHHDRPEAIAHLLHPFLTA
jgi:pimeloyl-ACP methyl ester carboxylesterase